MCTALKHGGPDDEGIYIDENVNLVFGHRRLSIIDLSPQGHQPMTDFEKRACITFNGEIYNYRELKEELLNLGTKFKSDSDTEVILAAYLYWGTKAFAKLRGMFAFALYDVSEAVTYLVRDITGIKPLYYHSTHDQIIFSSEIKAFKAARLMIDPSESWQIQFLAYGHVPEPYTTLNDVWSLKKGHYLKWHHRLNTHSLVSFAEQKDRPSTITDIKAARVLIADSLTAAIKRQLIADAPLGVFLSGGTDSSLLTLLAGRENKRLRTVSIYFDEKNYDERNFQSTVLDKLDGEKFMHLVKQKDFEQFFPHIMRDMDMPTTDGINTWFISKFARDDGLKTVLSGIGADELFGGYPSFNRINYLRYARKTPTALLNVANYLFADRYRKISFLKHRHIFADYLLMRGLFVPDDIAKLLNTDQEQVNTVLFQESDLPVLNSYNEEHASWFETNIYMQNQLLRDTDVLSMCHGLEVRVPFLDEDFQSSVHRIVPGIRYSIDQPKKLLVDSFNGLLPESVWNRRKMGFSFPLQQWMANHTDISEAALYEGKYAKKLVKQFQQGNLHWSKLFALYQIQLNG